MRFLQITDLLTPGQTHETPFAKRLSAIRAYGRMIDTMGRRLTREQVCEIAEQLQSLRFIQSGYLCLLVPRDIEHEWLSPEMDNNRTSIGIGIKTQSIFPFIYGLLKVLPPKTDFKIEIPTANILLTQFLISIDKEDTETALKVFDYAGKVPEDDWLPVIAQLSNSCIIPDYTQAYKTLSFHLK